MKLKKVQQATLSLIFFLGISIALLLAFAIRENQQQLEELKYKEHCLDIASLIEKEIERNFNALIALRSFYESSDSVSLEEFTTFTKPFLQQVKSIQVLAWIPEVPLAQKPTFEGYFQDMNFPDFRFMERHKDGLIPVKDRPVYYPVYFIAPMEGNMKAWGFDLHSNLSRRAALTKARETNMKTVTSKITLVQETGQQFGIIVFYPVFKNGAFIGFVDAAYRVDDLINHATRSVRNKSINIRVYENKQIEPENQIYPAAMMAENEIQDEPDDPFFFKKEIRIADKKWLLVCTPASTFLAASPRFIYWLILALGFLTTFLTSIIFAFLYNHLNIKEQEQEKLQLSLQKEKELGKLKSDFITLASHEFRTPLSTIQSSAALIKRYTTTETQEKRMKHVNRIIGSVRSLTTILEEFLSLGKINEGKIGVKKMPFDVLKLSAELLEEIENVKKGNQEIRFITEVESLELVSDKNLVKNALLNLLSNASKYSPPESVIEFSVSIVDDMVLFAVKDQGMGIPEKDQAQLFSRFFRAGNTRNIQGTGLGLHIVKNYMTLLGGDIYFTSKEQEGSVFYIKIPLVRVDVVG